MANVFKKIGRGIKKFSKSKFGRVALGLGATALGVGAAVKITKGIRGAKALRALKGVKVKPRKGLFAGLRKKDEQAIFGNGIDRLANKIKRKAARKQRRYDRKAARLEKRKSKLEQQLAAARGVLGSNESSAVALDTDFVEEQLGKIRDLERDVKELPTDADEFVELDAKDTDLPADGSGAAMSDGAKRVAIGVGALAAGYGLGKVMGWIK